MDIKEKLRKSIEIRKNLDNPSRRFVTWDGISETMRMEYNYLDASARIVHLARENTGTISDAYILYAVAMLGICDIRAIVLLLTALSKKERALYIPDAIGDSSARVIPGRMKSLSKIGFLHKIEVQVPSWKKDEKGYRILTLYSVTRDATNFVNAKLRKRVACNEMIQFMPIEDLCGWASTALAGVRAAQSPHFDIYLDRIFRCRLRGVGAIFFPCECRFKMEDGTLFYVAFLNAFIERDKRIQTEEDYKEFVARKFTAMQQYIRGRTNKGTAVVVVVVKDNKDLVQMGRYIIGTGGMEDIFPYVFFTGEGAMDASGKLGGGFLQLERVDGRYEFVAETPVFLV